jgi:hypothetical protein
VDCSLLSIRTEYERAVTENSILPTEGKSLSVTFTGTKARLSVDISVTLTLTIVGGEKYSTELRNVVDDPLCEKIMSTGRTPVANDGGNTIDMFTDDRVKILTKSI